MFLNLGNILRISILESVDLQGKRFAARTKWRLFNRMPAVGRILGDITHFRGLKKEQYKERTVNEARLLCKY